MGNHVETALLKKVLTEYQTTMKIVASEKVDIKPFNELKQKIDSAMKRVAEKLVDLESEQVHIKASVQENTSIINDLSGTLSIQNKNVHVPRMQHNTSKICLKNYFVLLSLCHFVPLSLYLFVPLSL